MFSDTNFIQIYVNARNHSCVNIEILMFNDMNFIENCVNDRNDSRVNALQNGSSRILQMYIEVFRRIQ